MASRLVGVLLIGGRGERFWPRSRQALPKQYLPIASELPLLVETRDRLAPVCSRLLGILNYTQAALAEGILRAAAASRPVLEFIPEPVGRSTAPALGLAAIRVAADDILVAAPADHHIPDAEAFRRVLADAAILAAEKDGIVCFGLKPTRPETGYGYMRPGEAAGPGFRIAAFVEKPPAARAEKLVREGALWNGGIFVVRAGVYLDLVRRHLPALAEVLETIRKTGDLGPFEQAPALSIDHGILEKEEASWGVRADFVWDDLGDWSAMTRLLPADPQGNAASGDWLGLDARDCVAVSDEGLVAAIGVEGVTIVRHRDAVLVVKRGQEQRVREVVAKLAERGMEKYR